MDLIITGKIVHCAKPYEVEYFEQGYVIVKKGKIVAIGNDQAEIKNSTKEKIINLSENQLLIPGLIDTHIHAPQYPNVGLGYDLPLLQWLNKYTYKLESLYNDLEFSALVYNGIVSKSIQYGTTTACYFGSMYEDSCEVLVESVMRLRQRAFVGKVNMTKNAPVNYIETPEKSLEDTEKFIKFVLDKNTDLVKPIITPRFALSVDMDFMKKLAEITAKYDCNVQTHISENLEEVRAVEEEYGMSYAKVYDTAGLLKRKTILAHGIYLKDEELKLISQRGTSVAHCPESNIRLQSGLCDVRKLRDYNIAVGLGTDIGAGSGVSIIEAMRYAIDTSNNLHFQYREYKPITYQEAFYMATLGGATALSIDNKVGNFTPGKDFDALIVDMDPPNLPLFMKFSIDELIQKFIYTGDDRNIKKVFVAGHEVKI